MVAIHNRALTAGADHAELRRGRRRALLPAVLGRAPHQRAAELRDVRGKPVRQLLVPVQQAGVHQPRRQPGPGPDPHPGPAHRHQRRRGQGRPGLRAARPHGHGGGLRAGDRLRPRGHRHGGRARQGPVGGRVLPELRADRHATATPFVEPAPTPLPPPPDGDPASEIGLRTFEEISASMSEHDGRARRRTRTSPRPTTACASSCRRSRTSRASCPRTRSAPRSSRSSTATSSWTTARLRAAYFPGFNFGRRAATAFDTPAERAQITGPLVARAVGTGIATQPTPPEITAEVDALIGRLTACGGSCAADRTEVVVKAACSAVVGSASTLLQ